MWFALLLSYLETGEEVTFTAQVRVAECAAITGTISLETAFISNTCIEYLLRTRCCPGGLGYLNI